jgi:hypothetical protein
VLVDDIDGRSTATARRPAAPSRATTASQHQAPCHAP